MHHFKMPYSMLWGSSENLDLRVPTFGPESAHSQACDRALSGLRVRTRSNAILPPPFRHLLINDKFVPNSWKLHVRTRAHTFLYYCCSVNTVNRLI